MDKENKTKITKTKIVDEICKKKTLLWMTIFKQNGHLVKHIENV